MPQVTGALPVTFLFKVTPPCVKHCPSRWQPCY